MTDSLGSSVVYPSSLAPGSLLPYQTMPGDDSLGYTVRTQSLVHELREERDLRIMELVDKKVRDGSGIASPEYARQVDEINTDIREQLEVLVGFDPDPLRKGLTRAFANVFKGYRGPSRSRSPLRRRHPEDDGPDLEEA